ncbi:hypothetical protein NK6_5770 [Bradyrhizobium diazoefficiens]|uniref:Uncharacterized protein n=1 Tax=Bradyrhizobium diazoefficiens TaxID=1355477 RepID=A0A0E4BRH4_9BRAD|nr:hypothetical protein NK6_5770 [Bradyrhizobium diazoefficiens]
MSARFAFLGLTLSFRDDAQAPDPEYRDQRYATISM